MSLIKTSLLNSIAVIVKLLTLLGINKLLAIYVGPSGYAALGQFQNAVQMVTTFASGAINTGVTKYTAEYHNDPEAQHNVWKTASAIALFGSLITSIVIAVFNKQLALWFLKNEAYGSVFIWFSTTLVFFIFNTLLLAVLNGKKDIYRYVVANISGSIFALIITGLLSINMGLYGALISLAIYQSLTFFVTLTLCARAEWFKFKFFFGSFDKKVSKNLFKYTAMALTSATCIPISNIFIRNHIGETLGWDSAGQWEAMWRLSSAYLMLITTTLSVYLLPRLSELKSKTDINKELSDIYIILLPLITLGCTLIYFFRDRIIVILFSNDFRGMEVLFAPQLIGDFFKTASWVLGFYFISKAYFKLYIFIEIYFSLQFSILVYFMTIKFGLKGAGIAHAINYISCFIFVIVVFQKEKYID